MFYLVPLMLEKVGIILIALFLLSQIKSFRQIVQREHTRQDKIMLIILFGAFGVFSNYTGIEINHTSIEHAGWYSGIDQESAIANTRVLGVVIGGLLGGPAVGVGAGLIAGLHRYLLGGFTAFSCSVSTILAGVVSGYLGAKRKKITEGFAVAIGMTLELVQMLVILATAKPFEQALELVQLIGIPMISVNGLGMMLFMHIIHLMKREEERTLANQTDKVFSIADQTLPYFRQGLNVESCEQICKLILNMTDADAVAITDNQIVLSHVGMASDHHTPMSKPETALTRKVLESGKIFVATSKEDIACHHQDCPLEAAIVIPLQVKNRVAGTLKMYYEDPEKLDQVQRQLATGLASLFSTQLELVEAERQTKLLKDAKIKALQAQIHPHFLFNSLNTISALCRTDPEKARELLLELSSFFRGNLQGAGQLFVPLKTEIENVKAYLSLVQARFPDKYRIHFQIEPNLEKIPIPPFLLQPIVENSINYGFPGSKQKGEINIRIFTEQQKLLIVIEDNGKGIPKEKLAVLGTQIVESKKGSGTAIFNICQRLKGIYGDRAYLTLDSKENQGTSTTISIPINSQERIESH